VWIFERQPPGERNLCLDVDGSGCDITYRIELAAGQRNDLGDIPVMPDARRLGA
jgi:hypothetical protein